MLYWSSSSSKDGESRPSEGPVLDSRESFLLFCEFSSGVGGGVLSGMGGREGGVSGGRGGFWKLSLRSDVSVKH